MHLTQLPRQLTPLRCNVLFSLLFTALFLVGCQTEKPTESVANDSPAIATEQAAQTQGTAQTEQRLPGKQTAMQAKDALAERLTARLTQAMSNSGPAAAIEVCSQEAPKLAAEVGQEFGVKIGRTSFKLRNPNNQPPAWAVNLIEQKMDTPHFQQLDDGATAAFLPIKLQPQCLACHGDPATLPAEISDALHTLYPDDTATGFAAGDLRGWFWIEVPNEK